MTAVNTAFTICAGISFVLVLIPRPWHLQVKSWNTWNTGALLFRFWSALGVFNLFVNSIVWRDDAIIRAPVWCDISSRIISSVALGLPITAMCINRRVYHIAAGRHSGLTDSKDERRRAVMFDFFVGFVIPGILYLPLVYVIQVYRFAIIEEFGCFPTPDPSVLALLLVNVPPLIIALISVGYAVRTIVIFRKRRLQIGDMLASTGLTSTGYFRLIALSGTKVVGCLPLTTYGVVSTLAAGVRPYVFSEHVHRGLIVSLSSIQWRNSFPPYQIARLEINRWVTVICAAAYFGYYGTTQTSRRLYEEDAYKIARYLRLLKPRLRDTDHRVPTSSSPSALPIFFRETRPLDTLNTESSMTLSTLPPSLKA